MLQGFRKACLLTADGFYECSRRVLNRSVVERL